MHDPSVVRNARSGSLARVLVQPNWRVPGTHALSLMCVRVWQEELAAESAMVHQLRESLAKHRRSTSYALAEAGALATEKAALAAATERTFRSLHADTSGHCCLTHRHRHHDRVHHLPPPATPRFSHQRGQTVGPTV